MTPLFKRAKNKILSQTVIDLQSPDKHDLTAKDDDDKVQIIQKVAKKQIRCSICMKAIKNDQFFQCQKKNCLKKYHFKCMQNQNQCSRCKDKPKQVIKLSEDKLNLKQFITEQNRNEFQEFRSKYPEYIQDETIIKFPIKDSLFKQYSFLKNKTTSKNQVKQKPKSLPSNFTQIVEAWNFFITLSNYLKLNPYTTIHEINKTIQDVSFWGIYLKLLKILFQEAKEKGNETDLMKITSHMNNKSDAQIFIRMFRHKILLELIEIYDREGVLISKQTKLKLIEKTNNKDVVSIQNDQNYEFLQILMKILKKSQKFSLIVFDEKKPQEFDKKTRRLSIFDIKKKKSEKCADQLKYKIKLATFKLKELKSSKKNKEDKEIFTNSLIQQIKIEEQIKKDNRELRYLKLELSKFQSLSVQFSQSSFVHFLGKDRTQMGYWLIQSYCDRIFVEDNGKWGYYMLKDIEKCLQFLNRKGIQQQKIHHTLQNLLDTVLSANYLEFYKRKNDKGDQTEKDDEQDTENEVFLKNISNVSYEVLKNIIIETELLISKKLSGQNSWWGGKYEKSYFLEKIERPKFKNIEEIKGLVKQFNQKVCWVYGKKDNGAIQKMKSNFWGKFYKLKASWVNQLDKVNKFYDLFLVCVILFIQSRYFHKKKDKIQNNEI